MARFAIYVFACLLIAAYGQSTNSSSSTTPSEDPTDAPTTNATTPATTSSTSTDATTTSPASTTEAPPNTTTPADTTTSTSTAAPPTTATPAGDGFFRVTENNVTCIMFSGDISYSVSYLRVTGEVGTATVKIPQPNDPSDVASTGSCNATVNNATAQYIQLTWGATNERSSFNLLFNSTGSKWMLTTIEANVYLDEKNFVNATDAGKFVNIVGQFPGLSNVSVDTNSSLTCRAAVSSTSFTAQVVNSSATYTATGSAVGIKLQAYNSIAGNDLQLGTRCEQDYTSDMVPIAVGCALAGLVFLVLISYLVGRRRRSAAYQSV